MSSSFLLTISFLFSQGYVMRSRSTVWRLLCGSWLVAALIIGFSYKTNLIAVLSLPKVNIPFDSLEELINQDDIPYRSSRGSFFSEAIEASPPGSLMHKVFQKLDGYEDDVRNIIPAVFSGKYAFISNRIPIIGIITDYLLKTGRCGAQISTEASLAVPTSFVYTKNFPLKTQIDMLITKFRESGILKKLLKDALNTKASICMKPGARSTSEAQLRALEIEDFYGVFSLYFGGMVLSAFTFILELLIRKFYSKDLNFATSRHH